MTDQAQPVGDMGELVPVEWLRRDPVTGNLVSDTPPRQFSTADLTRMLEEKATLLSNVERLTRALELVDAECERAGSYPDAEWLASNIMILTKPALSNTTQRTAE